MDVPRKSLYLFSNIVLIVWKMEETTKIVSLLSATDLAKLSKKVATEKPKRKRVVTETNKWRTTVSVDHLLEDAQSANLAPLFGECDNLGENSKELVAQQIRTKISGYLAQDKEKGLHDPEKFVVFQDVVRLFESAQMCCYYCKKGVLVYYEFVREPKQWTLERLDNSQGHNSDNVVLSCLRCNLRRRCMNSERYVKTKEMDTVVKHDGTDCIS